MALSDRTRHALMTLRKESFVAWLKSKAPSTVVGTAWNACDCPIHHFILDHLHVDLAVGPDVFAFTDETVSMPSWVSAAVSNLDRGCVEDGAITAAEALRAVGGDHATA